MDVEVLLIMGDTGGVYQGTGKSLSYPSEK